MDLDLFGFGKDSPSNKSDKKKKAGAQVKDEEKPLVFKRLQPSARGQWVLCEYGFGWLQPSATPAAEKQSDDDIVRVRLPFGICYCPRSSLLTKISLNLFTFFTPTPEVKDWKASASVDVDLNKDSCWDVITRAAAAYSVKPDQLTLVNGTSTLGQNSFSTSGKLLTPPKLAAQRFSLLSTGPGSRHSPRACSSNGFPLLALIEEQLCFRWRAMQDTEGIMHYIGTSEGSAPYRNPLSSGENLARIHMSTSAGHAPASVADRNFFNTSAENSYGEEDEPWICMEFKNLELACSDYCVYQYRNHMLRSWVFQGSNDTCAPEHRSWTTLKTYNDDETIKPGFQPCGRFQLKPASPYFRSFRIKLTGPSHSGENNFDITQLEFYGQARSVA